MFLTDDTRRINETIWTKRSRWFVEITHVALEFYGRVPRRRSRVLGVSDGSMCSLSNDPLNDTSVRYYVSKS